MTKGINIGTWLSESVATIRAGIRQRRREHATELRDLERVARALDRIRGTKEAKPKAKTRTKSRGNWVSKLSAADRKAHIAKMQKARWSK